MIKVLDDSMKLHVHEIIFGLILQFYSRMILELQKTLERGCGGRKSNALQDESPEGQAVNCARDFK